VKRHFVVVQDETVSLAELGAHAFHRVAVDIGHPATVAAYRMVMVGLRTIQELSSAALARTTRNRAEVG
jgi:hypothetical protein